MLHAIPITRVGKRKNVIRGRLLVAARRHTVRFVQTGIGLAANDLNSNDGTMARDVFVRIARALQSRPFLNSGRVLPK